MIELTVTIILIVLTILLFGASHCLRMLTINSKTFRQRIELQNAVFSSSNWRAYSEMLNAVSYEEHMAALIWWRNPYNLYDPELIRRLWEYRAGQGVYT